MSARTVTCIAIICDVCDTEYDLEGEGYTQHFDNLPGAVTFLADDEWKVQSDGYAVCPSDDEDHEQARAALAPKPPVGQVPGQQEIPAVRGYRIGDMVQITGRGLEHDGHIAEGQIGYVTEIDDNPECSIGLTVEGFVGLVWCNSTEVRHLDAAEVAAAEAGAR